MRTSGAGKSLETALEKIWAEALNTPEKDKTAAALVAARALTRWLNMLVAHNPLLNGHRYAALIFVAKALIERIYFEPADFDRLVVWVVVE